MTKATTTLTRAGVQDPIKIQKEYGHSATSETDVQQGLNIFSS